jgi:hypothetical protein
MHDRRWFFSADGDSLFFLANKIVGGQKNRQVALKIDASSGEVLSDLLDGPSQRYFVNRCALRPGANGLVTASAGMVDLWDGAMGLITQPIYVGDNVGVQELQFSQDGSTLAVITGGDEILIYELSTDLPPAPLTICDLLEGLGGSYIDDQSKIQSCPYPLHESMPPPQPNKFHCSDSVSGL